MADRKQVRRLLQGVEGWNQWREEAATLSSDRRHAKPLLSVLWSAKFFFVVFWGLVRNDAKLRPAQPKNSLLISADLRAALLDFANSRGREAYLKGAALRNADLMDAALMGADLRSANLSGANLEGADLRSADLGGANLNSAYRRQTN